MFTPQSTAPTRHWIPAYKIIIIFGDVIRHVRFVWKKERNRRVDLNRAINESRYIPEIPCLISYSEVRGYSILNQDLHHMYIIELRLLECC
jgi:hypothetical protein